MSKASQELDKVQATLYALSGFAVLMRAAQIEPEEMDKVYALLTLLLDRMESELDAAYRQAA